MEIKLASSCPFDLDVTLCCGQTFRWDKQGEWWYGVVGKRVFKIRQIGRKLEFENADADFVENYFGLKMGLTKILSKINIDEHIAQAVNAFKGLQILRQDPWECLISYICATCKNIPAIKQMLFNLSKKFGEKVHFDERDFFTFPIAKRLAEARIEELVSCGLGYRAKYVSETAKMAYDGSSDFDDLKKLSYENAKKELLKFSGVGLKVADCVLLFSVGKFEAFPVDVWIKRIILKYYTDHFPKEFIKKVSNKKGLTNLEYETMNAFGRKYFGEYAGYAQEYLYHYERSQN